MMILGKNNKDNNNLIDFNQMKADFSRRMAEEQDARGLKQNEFAEELGLTTSVMSDVISGKRGPSFETLVSIAKNGNMDMNYLLLGSSNKDTSETVHWIMESARRSDEEFNKTVMEMYRAHLKTKR